MIQTPVGDEPLDIPRFRERIRKYERRAPVAMRARGGLHGEPGRFVWALR